MARDENEQKKSCPDPIYFLLLSCMFFVFAGSSFCIYGHGRGCFFLWGFIFIRGKPAFTRFQSIQDMPNNYLSLRYVSTPTYFFSKWNFHVHASEYAHKCVVLCDFIHPYH